MWPGMSAFTPHSCGIWGHYLMSSFISKSAVWGYFFIHSLATCVVRACHMGHMILGLDCCPPGAGIYWEDNGQKRQAETGHTELHGKVGAMGRQNRGGDWQGRVSARLRGHLRCAALRRQLRHRLQGREYET